MPTFEAAQEWPEAQALPGAQEAADSYDRAPIVNEIQRVVARERIAVAPECPVCGETG